MGLERFDFWLIATLFLASRPCFVHQGCLIENSLLQSLHNPIRRSSYCPWSKFLQRSKIRSSCDRQRTIKIAE